jgi:hypothetical protein
MPDHTPKPYLLPLVIGTDAVSDYEDGERDMEVLDDFGKVLFYSFPTQRDRRMFLLGLGAALDHRSYTVAEDLVPYRHETDVEHVALGEADEPICQCQKET